MNNQAPHNIELRKVLPDLETRDYAGTVEVREMGDGKKKLSGYALKFGQRYSVGWFTEEVKPGALDKADLTDVRALLNHDPNFVLGRTTAGTLRLEVDAIGLRYDIYLPETQAGRDLATSIERGDINQSSWGFTLGVDDNNTGDVWTRENGKDHRSITGVRKVYDVSPVTFPANPDTTVAKRSLEAYAKREGMEDMPAESMPVEITTTYGGMEACTDAINELNELIGEAQAAADANPDHSDLYGAVIEAHKAAISAHLEIIAAMNGTRTHKDIINQREQELAFLKARF